MDLLVCECEVNYSSELVRTEQKVTLGRYLSSFSDLFICCYNTELLQSSEFADILLNHNPKTD